MERREGITIGNAPKYLGYEDEMAKTQLAVVNLKPQEQH